MTGQLYIIKFWIFLLPIIDKILKFMKFQRNFEPCSQVCSASASKPADKRLHQRSCTYACTYIFSSTCTSTFGPIASQKPRRPLFQLYKIHIQNTYLLAANGPLLSWAQSVCPASPALRPALATIHTAHSNGVRRHCHCVESEQKDRGSYPVPTCTPFAFLGACIWLCY